MKSNNLRDVLSTTDGKVAKLEVAVEDMRENLEIVESQIEKLDFVGEELKGEMQSAFNLAIGILTQKNDALEAVVEATKKPVEELMGIFNHAKQLLGQHASDDT